MKTKLDNKTTATPLSPCLRQDRGLHWDKTLDRFGLRLRRSGARVLRSWVVQYRRGGSTRRMTIGSAEVLSPEQARAAARKVLAKVDLGEDPQTDRSERRNRDKLSFRSVVAEYLETKLEELRPATRVHVLGYLTRPQYFRALWGMPIDQITRKDVAAQLLVIARQSGRPTAGCARSVLSALFTWAMRMGLVEQNPVIGTEQPKANPARNRILSDSELVAVWNAADGDDDFARIVRLLILLPCRRQEVGGMCWSEIDPDAATWTIPRERVKNGRAITLPLMPLALDIIRTVPRRGGRDQLFGNFHHAGFSSWHKGKPLLDQKTGITAAWNLHDIRRSVATRMADLGIAPHVIEQILNHQSGHRAGVAGVYNRSSYEREVRAALALWEDHVRSLVEGGARKVVALAAGQ